MHQSERIYLRLLVHEILYEYENTILYYTILYMRYVVADCLLLFTYRGMSKKFSPLYSLIIIKTNKQTNKRAAWINSIHFFCFFLQHFDNNNNIGIVGTSTCISFVEVFSSFLQPLLSRNTNTTPNLKLYPRSRYVYTSATFGEKILV